MKSFNVFTALRTLMLLISLAVGPLALTALAQNSAPAPAGGGASTSSQTTTTTTKSTAKDEVTGINPIWWVVGGIALLLILLLVVLAARGRDRVDVVRESSTVVKKE